MTILDYSYFHGDIYLPHLIANSGVVGQSAMNQFANQREFVEDYISKYEPDFLKKVLGNIYNDFISGITAETPLQKWIDLKNALYKSESSGRYHFNYSPAANYVYFFITKRIQTTSTGKGESRLKNSNADIASAYRLMMDAWNDMSIQVADFYRDFLYPNWENYKMYGQIPCHCFGLINELGI